MRISVVIPTWRRPDALARCLEGLERQHRRPDDVVVVVREEDAETRSLLDAERRAVLAIRMAFVREPGLVAALNRGLDATRGDVVAFTDDDTVPAPDWVERIERHFAADPRLGGLGGRDRVHPPCGEPSRRTVGRVRWYGRVIGNHHLGEGPARPVDVLKGANMSFRLAALAGARVDECLKGSGAQVHTEVDLCFGVRQRGWKLVYDPAVSVDHFPAERIDDDSRLGPATGATLEHVIHNETYLLLKWLPWWRRLAAVMYWSLVGTRLAPGLLVLGERLSREHDRALVLRRFAATVRGRSEGVRTLMRG